MQTYTISRLIPVEGQYNDIWRYIAEKVKKRNVDSKRGEVTNWKP